MIPLNEMGVIVEFSRYCGIAGWEIVSIQAAFPDVLIMNKDTGESIRAEFEYNSSSFYAHRHDPFGCDLIICWKHDWKECVMPVWELSDEDWTTKATVTPMDQKDRKIMFLLVELQNAKAKIAAMREKPENPGGFVCECGFEVGSQAALNAHQRKHKQIIGYAVSMEPIKAEKKQ
jgi:hypothetical protein